MATEKPAPASPPPPPIARRFVRYVVGFGITVGIGLAPFLGKIVGVDALLDLYPESLRRSSIPLSVFMMGFIAVAVQFYSGESLRRATLLRRFRRSLIALVAGFALLVVSYHQLVLSVPIARGQRAIPRVIGLSRKTTCGCQPPSVSDIECVQQLSLDEAKIETCWNTKPSLLLLQGSYLLLTGGFAALVGLLILQEEARKQERAKAGAGPKTRAPSRRRTRPPL